MYRKRKKRLITWVRKKNTEQKSVEQFRTRQLLEIAKVVTDSLTAALTIA
jgi:hypothetical protein